MITSDDRIPPDFLERIDPDAFSVSELIGLVIAHHGAPLSFEEIAVELANLGVFRAVPSIRKTWARLSCLRKTTDGKLEVVREAVEYSAWDSLAFRVRDNLGLVKSRAAEPEPPKPPVDAASPVVTEEALRGLKSRRLTYVSLRRKLALLAEANGGPLSVGRAIELVSESMFGVTEKSVHSAMGGPVFLDEDGRIRHVPGHDSLTAARRLLREGLRALDEEAERERAAARWSEEWEQKQRIQGQAKLSEYLEASKVVIRCVFTRTGFAAGSILDPDAREFHDFVDAAELASRLSGCDIVFGIDPWTDLERLGVERPPRVIDLAPPTKTIQLNRRGRTLKVKPELVIRSTLGISTPLGDRKKLDGYVKEGSLKKLFRRLHADLKNLWRLYEYGCLHGFVRIQLRYLDEQRGVNWNVGGLPRLRELLAAAKDEKKDLEMVFDSVPGWEDPWSRGVRARVAGVRGSGWHREYLVELVDFGEHRVVRDDEVFAARFFPSRPPPASSARDPGAAGEDSTGGTFTWPEDRDDRVS